MKAAGIRWRGPSATWNTPQAIYTAQPTLHDWANYGNVTSPVRGNLSYSDSPIRTCYAYDVTGAVVKKKVGNQADSSDGV